MNYSHAGKAVKKVLEFIKNGVVKIVLAACPGSGKTWMSFDIITNYLKDNPNARILVLTHGTTIIRNNYSSQYEEYKNYYDINPFTLSLDINSNAQVIVALPHIFSKKLPAFDLLIVDEAHEFYFATMAQKIINKIKPKHQILLTATPSEFILRNDIAKNKGKIKPYAIVTVPMTNLIGTVLSDVLIELGSTSFKLRSNDYTENDEIAVTHYDRYINEFNKIADELLACILHKISSSKRLSPEMYRFVHNAPILKGVTNSMKLNKYWNMVFSYLKKTMIVVPPNTEIALVAKKYFADRVGEDKVVVSYSGDNDEDSSIIDNFKQDDKLVLIVVKRANLGFNCCELANLVDLSFTRNINRIYQMLCRVNRKSKKGVEKFFFKIVPNELAPYFEHLMTCALCLMDDEWLNSYNGHNFLNLPIPIRKNWKPIKKKKSKGRRTPPNPKLIQYLGIPSLQAFKDIIHKDKHILNSYCYTTMLAVSNELIRKRNQWSKNLAEAAARSCKTFKEFTEKYSGAYYYLLDNGCSDLLREIFPDMRVDWDVSSAIKKAKECSDIGFSKTDFIKEYQGAYVCLRENHSLSLIDNLFVLKQNKKIINKTTEDMLKIAAGFSSREELKNKRRTVYLYLIKECPNRLDNLFIKYQRKIIKNIKVKEAIKKLYLKGTKVKDIILYLKKKEIKTDMGKKTWAKSTIFNILKKDIKKRRKV